MSEVLAGAMAGIVMGVLTIGIGALALPSLRDWGPLKSLLPTGQILFVTFLLMALLLPPAWALVGTFSGLAYRYCLSAYPGGGLGSPNLAFTSTVVLIFMVLAFGQLLFRGRALWHRLTMTVLFVAIFGWLLPWLAA